MGCGNCSEFNIHCILLCIALTIFHFNHKPLQWRGLFVFGLYFFIGSPFCVQAQQRTRGVSSDYSIMEVLPNGEKRLSMGTIRFDAESLTLQYDNHFPSKYEMLINDTALHFIREGVVERKEPAGQIAEFSVFNLILKAQLGTFGLRNSPFEMTESTNDGEMILSRWESKRALKGPLTAYEIALKDNKLFGIITRGKNDEVLGKQFFSEYLEVEGLLFPTKCEEVRYEKEGTHTKVTTYSNIHLL